MKHSIFAVAAFALALAAQPACAQIFGQLTPAQPIPLDTRLGGGFLSFTKSESELLGQLRMSFHPGVDFGFQGGLSRVSVQNVNRTSVQLGGDVKAQVVRMGPTSPLDCSIGAAIGVNSADDFTVLSMGPTLVMSRTVRIDERAYVTPFAGAALLFSRSDLATGNKTDVAVPLRFGLEYTPLPDFRLLAALQVGVSDEIRDDLKLTLGANFPF
ncbi:MAG: hypothetical protein HZA61_12530 [Candidatus Eisenbacteria bacterium]|uniref:Outer membrane protein beta-barrel domain-containing protein n=1 Tax=Eiseniibacteriota bacterium TaxID=2212470 RepID=A0A933W9T7_UNCEI|nr:hypothetical protein [Candidatus Eisenbacteria bacterium]